MTAVMQDDTELFKQFADNEGFKRWMTDTVFGLTYEGLGVQRGRDATKGSDRSDPWETTPAGSEDEQ
jgi:hypothetical protein